MTENEKVEANKKRVSECLARNYKQYKLNIRKEEFYIWTKYAESKGISVYAMVKQAVEAAIEKDGFTPDIPYEDSIK